MNRMYVVGGVLVVVVLALALGGAFYTGVGPAPGGGSDDTIEDFPTATTSDDGSTDTGSDSGTTAEISPFTFTIDNTETCGQTCRDVTATLHNNQNDTATGLTVFTRIFAGENSTGTDDMVWEGTEEIGSLEANGSHTTTTRVELSLQEGQEINQNDGWITILTTVESDDTTVTFQNSEQVG